MKLICSIGILVIACAVAPSVRAQAPEWEIFGGVSYLHASSGFAPITLADGTKVSLTQNAYGWNSSIAENKTTWFGGVMDFSGNYANRTIEGVQLNGSAYTYLFGPQFAYRRVNRVSLFAHPLIGLAHVRASYSGATAPFYTNTKWAYALGGGADVQLTPHVATRVQADWIRSHFPETLDRDFENNYRVSVGFVLTLGATTR